MGADGDEARLAENRERQRDLYGAPIGDRVRRLTAALAVSQARVARALGISPAMLSQLVSGRRVKIGDPGVLSRLVVLDQRSRLLGGLRPPSSRVVDALLADVARARWEWTAPEPPPPRLLERPPPPASAAEALRGLAEPARLAAAAAALAPAFPELADVLRQAAGRPPQRRRPGA
jgi:transcriptional regulator with XRE-family HTH domain